MFLVQREKYLTEQLKKIYGPTFSVDNDLNPLTPESGGLSKRFPTSLMHNGHGPGSPLSGGMFIGEKQRRRSGFGLLPTSSKTPSFAEEAKGETAAALSEQQVKQELGNTKDSRSTDIEPAVLMEQLVNVQSLLERFEKRLLARESELIKKEREAMEQIEKLQAVVGC